MDYPRSDRHFSLALRRLTRIQTRSVEQPINMPGEGAWVRRHMTYEYDGYVPRWRGIYDDKGRLMVVICHNMDLGDSWEHADNPEYPQKFSALGIRIGVNYVTYAVTH